MKKIEIEKTFDSVGELTELKKMETTTNESGQILHVVHFAGTEKVTEFNYFYDGIRLVRREEIFEPKQINTVIYKYNDSNQKISEIGTSVDGQKLYEIVFDEKTNVETTVEYDLDGNEFLMIKKILDEKGRVVQEIEPLDYVTNSKYENDRLVLVEIYDQGELSLKESYLYDKSGNIIESEGFDYEINEKQEIKSTYDNSGLLVLEKEFKNDELIQTNTFQYDDQKRLIHSESKGKEESITVGIAYVAE